MRTGLLSPVSRLHALPLTFSPKIHYVNHPTAGTLCNITGVIVAMGKGYIGIYTFDNITFYVLFFLLLKCCRISNVYAT